MTNPSLPSTPAGWYPDPAGSPRNRWWDGTQWTENYHDPLQAAQLNTYALKAPEGTTTTTLWFWGLVVLTVINLLVGLTVFLPGNLETAIATGLSDDAPLFTPTDVISSAVNLLLIAAFVLFSYFDFNALRENGVPKPFHWAWSFFAFLFYPLYLFGRAIVINRRTGSGLAGIALPIVYLIATIAIFFVAIGIGLQAAFTNSTGL